MADQIRTRLMSLAIGMLVGLILGLIYGLRSGLIEFPPFEC